jgi:hypothetical protein
MGVYLSAIAISADTAHASLSYHLDGAVVISSPEKQRAKCGTRLRGERRTNLDA